MRLVHQVHAPGQLWLAANYSIQPTIVLAVREVKHFSEGKSVALKVATLVLIVEQELGSFLDLRRTRVLRS
jgi:hypothetical protein